MKRMLLGFACAACASAALAATYTWTGAGDGKSWSDVANWDSNPFATRGQTLRFTNSVSVVVDKGGTNAVGEAQWPGGFKVEDGCSVYLCRGGFPTHYLQGGNVTIDVAKDAQLVTSNGFNYFNFGPFTKKGEGKFTMVGVALSCGPGNTSQWQINGCVWNPVTVEAGTMELLNNGAGANPSNFVVKAGAELVVGGAPTANLDPAKLTIEEGATLRIGAKLKVGGLDGAGDIVAANGASILDAIIQSCCYAPDCVFTGNVGTNLQFVFDDGYQPFVVQRADQLAGAMVSAGEGMRFKSGIGTFDVGAFYGSSGRHFYLQDETGGVVTVRTTVRNDGYFAAHGPGNLTLVSNEFTTASQVKLYGANYHATGEVKATENVEMALGSNSAAQDLDYSGAGVKAVCNEGGTLNFQQYTMADVEVPVTGTGKIYFGAGGAKFRDVDYFNDAVHPKSVDISAPFELAGGEMVLKQLVGSLYPLATRGWATVSGGRLCAPYATLPGGKRVRPLPTGIDTYGTKGWFSFQVLGGEFWWKGNNAMKNLFLRGGRTYVESKAAMSTTPKALADGGQAQFVFDGGEAVLFDRDSNGDHYYFLDDGTNNVVYVTEKGGRVHAHPTDFMGYDRSFYVRCPVEVCTNVAASGALDFVGAGTFRFERPLNLNGPVRVLDGRVVIVKNMMKDADKPFGSGDFALRNNYLTWYSDFSETKTTTVAGGENGTFTFDGSSCIRFKWDSGKKPQNLRSHSLRRGGKGAALFLRTESGDPLGEEGGSSFKLDVAPASTAAGTVELPIVSFTPNFTYDFVSYDAEKGFVPFADYVSAISAESADKIVSLPGSAIVSADASALGVRMTEGWSSITVNPGVRLTLGDGVNPAFVMMPVAGNLGGSGTIDFGGSEGIFVPNNTTGVPGSHKISCKLAGTSGVSFVAIPSHDHDFKFILSAENIHTGGTYVNGVRVFADNVACFGADKVVVGGGEANGGSVVLRTAGEFANDFDVAGYGVAINGRGEHMGSIGFLAAATVSGDITILEATRMGVTNGVVGTISGVVSGDRLVVYNSAVESTTPTVNHDGTLALVGANTYTGGTEVVRATLALKLADGAGTGEIELDAGTLKFVNDAPITFTNAVSGVGQIVLAGSAPVTFSGKAFAALPLKTIAPGSSFAIDAIAFGSFVAWVDPDSGLDLGGKDISVFGVSGSGRVFGGTLTVSGEINPAGAGAIGTLSFEVAPVFNGATYVCDLVGDEADLIVLPAGFDVSSLAFRAALGPNFTATRTTVLSSQSVSGAFASAALPAGRWKVVVGTDKVEVVHNVGTALIVR